MTDLRTRPRLPDFDAEEEVDLGRYGRAVAARWWLLAAGIVAGLVIGYLVSLGSGDVYQASVTIYPGQPLSANSSSPIQGKQTNPRTITEIVHSEKAVVTAAARSGLRRGQLRGNVSTKTLSAGRGAARSGVVQYVQITVKGDAGRKVAIAANTLGQRVIAATSVYVDQKIAGIESRLGAVDAAIASQDQLIKTLTAAVRDARDLSTVERLIASSQLNSAQQLRSQLVDDQADAQDQLALAKEVEKPSIIEPAVARKTTARSPRNSMLVGAIIGLLLGASSRHTTRSSSSTRRSAGFPSSWTASTWSTTRHGTARSPAPGSSPARTGGSSRSSTTATRASARPSSPATSGRSRTVWT
jgi:capsular polysaccharide biosynthesis protein